MNGAPTEAARSIFDLEAEMIHHRDMGNAEDTPVADKQAHHDKTFALLHEIENTQAKTLPDLAAQARALEYVLVTWGSDWDGFENFARVVREGAERMAGDAA